MTIQLFRMPLTVFDIKGVPGNRRERIEAAVVAGGKHAAGPYEAWIAADPFNRGFRILLAGPHGFERTVTFASDDNPAVVAGRVRDTLEEERIRSRVPQSPNAAISDNIGSHSASLRLCSGVLKSTRIRMVIPSFRTARDSRRTRRRT